MAIYVGGALKKLRKAKGFTQETLALECELDRSYIGELERNIKSPSLETIDKISKALGIMPYEFVKVVYETREDYSVSQEEVD